MNKIKEEEKVNDLIEIKKLDIQRKQNKKKIILDKIYGYKENNKVSKSLI